MRCERGCEMLSASTLAPCAPSKVLSVEDLYEQGWNGHTDPFTNTVKVTIHRLRPKLGDLVAIENHPTRRLSAQCGQADSSGSGRGRDGTGVETTIEVTVWP